ncbi:MAG: hypothetical protein GTO41_02970, partial [Burkholderiales bacterium]|nr:hypothetical protein [Burkholderiales bacterium]
KRRGELQEIADNAKERLEAAREALINIERQIEFNEHADKVKQKAAGFAHSVASWVACADSLAPDGIPGEIVADRIKPLNDRLRHTAMQTEWPQTTVTPTMD